MVILANQLKKTKGKDKTKLAELFGADYLDHSDYNLL